MTYPDHNDSLTQRWSLDRAGRLELNGPAREDAAASGTITPVAASGWIELPARTDESLESLESRALDALALTQVLDRLESRFPGYRWFIRDGARAA